ncbi:uncharacterized protein V1513DRAFT_428808 [Lipomyces chichibuensis]|uniref:uncharacterized protein n=1 Tax=Lipomyces chichibuensis TaxID=1546026 RepID=UPI003343BB2E
MTTDASSQSELRALYTFKASAETESTVSNSTTHTVTVPLTSISCENSNDDDGQNTLDALASQLQTFQAEINAYLSERIDNSYADTDRDAMAKLERTVLDGEMENEDDDEQEKDE